MRVLAKDNFDALEKIWSQHLNLRPTKMGGPYAVESSIYEPRFYEKK